GQWAGPVGAVAARIAGLRNVVYVAHCPAFYHSTSLWRVLRNYFAEIVPCRLAKRVVALSYGSWYGYLYRGWVPEGHLVEIKNGVDLRIVPTSEEAKAFREQNLKPVSDVHAVFVGRIDDQKRVDWLLEAWAEAIRIRPTAAPGWHLWIVGGGSSSGNEEEKVKKLALEMNLGENVHFVGQRRDSMLWIAAGDFVVMSSLYEGHALVPLEAMACSKAVVAFNTHGIEDSVIHEETGLLAMLGDTNELGNMIAKIAMDESLRRKMGQRGRKRCEELFRVEYSLKKYEFLYEELMQKG
ncbi:MAG: glycosyltransferase family 4 protein, partial [Chthoniobacterales bacterium]|nr:glycosyltransferase family 4 protein [Chthoniobacterales bacterium]